MFIDATDSKSYRELHFDRTIETIYKHQHPEDCTEAKFLISSGIDEEDRLISE